MRLDELRAQFSLEHVYLATGAIAPMARPVRSAIAAWIDRSASVPLRNFESWGMEVEGLRSLFAGLVGADPGSIAITDGTSRAANIAIGMLAAHPNTNVLVDPTTYPSSLFPWFQKTHKRVVRCDRELDATTIERLGQGDLAAVVVSHVAWQSGYRHNLRALAEAAHAAGGILMVDAAQSAGAVPLDVVADGVDVLVTTAMKWLLGVPGVGFLYVNPRLLDTNWPHDVGYLSMTLPGGWDAWPAATLPELPPGARRFELGVPALPSVAAATAGLTLVSAVGVEALAVHIEALVTRCLQGLERLGVTTSTPQDVRQRAGVIALRHPRAAEFAGYLAGRNIDLWAADDLSLVRVDPAGYTDNSDVDRFLNETEGWLSAGRGS